MKKLAAGFFIFVVFLGMLPTPLFAQNGSDDDDTGNPNSWVTMKLPLSKAVEAIKGKIVGFSIIGDVIPLVIKPDELNFTDMSPFNSWFANPFSLLFPWQQKKNSIPYTNQNRESGRYCARLVIDAPIIGGKHRVDEVTKPNTVQMSHNIPWSQEFFTNAQYFGSILSGYNKLADAEGKLNFNLEEKILHKITKEDCNITNEGVEHEHETLHVTSDAAFGENAHVEAPLLYSITIEKIIHGILQTVFDLVDIKMELLVTAKKRFSNSFFGCLLAYGCTEKETGSEVTNHTRTPRDGFASALVAFAQRKQFVGHGASPNTIKLNIQGGGGNKDTISFQNPESVVNRAYESLRQSSCSLYPHQLVPKIKLGGVIPIADACAPSPKGEGALCSNKWEDVTTNLQSAINKAVRKFARYFPISEDQLKDMLNVIFDIEIRNDPAWSGANYRCAERPDSTAAGPFQIKTETYRIITNQCQGEYIPDDVKNCTADGLSRCDVFDAAELAMRALLFSAGRWIYTPHQCGDNRAVNIPSLSELFTAVCNFGTGVGVPMENLGGKTYCEYVFDAVGLPKP